MTAMEQKYIDLFWRKVDKSGNCWLWKGAKTDKGYGVAWDGRHTQKAHRVSFMLSNGYMPDLCVLHRCDVPGCVNPSHLFLGTRADNNRDMHAKGRHATKEAFQNGNHKRGEIHHASKVTAEKVRQMRSEYAAGGTSYSRLAKKYSLSLSSAYRIVNCRRWKHVE